MLPCNTLTCMFLQPDVYACNMRSEQVSEISVQMQGYDPVEIMTMWWHGSIDWSVAMERYRLFRKKQAGSSRKRNSSLCERTAGM